MIIEIPEIFIINGVDFAPFIEKGGLTYDEEDVHSEDSGRTMDRVMHIGWLEPVKKWGVRCIPIPQIISEVFLEALSPGWKTLETIDPHHGHCSRVFYCGPRKATMNVVDENGIPCWDGLSFNLIER